MAQYGFGSGMLWVTPKADAYGNVVAAPSPLLVGVLQDGSVDISFDLKTLFGQNQFAVAAARGKGKITGKAKFGQIFGALFNNVIFGQVSTGGLTTAQYDTSGQTIPATPFAITVAPANSGTFTRDLGVIGATGLPFKRVASAPASGQYMVDATGKYTFATADAGKNVYINYEYTVSSANAPTATTTTVKNLPMGYAPNFSADLMIPFEGKTLKITMYKCVSNKLGLSTKQDDFLIPEFDFEALADDFGNVLTYSTVE